MRSSIKIGSLLSALKRLTCRVQVIKTLRKYQQSNISLLTAKMGCIFEELKKGDGQTFPKSGQTVVVHYTGKLKTGKVFDCSRERNQPFRFVLGKGQVIKGWEENISKMSIGQQIKLTCPPEQAYGKRGFPGVIPPDSTLIFDIELLALE